MAMLTNCRWDAERQMEVQAPNLQHVMLRAAAQAICDAGGAMGAEAEVVENALREQLDVSQLAVSELSLLSGGLPSEPAGRRTLYVGEEGAGPLWTLCLGSASQEHAMLVSEEPPHVSHLSPMELLSHAAAERLAARELDLGKRRRRGEEA
mmetsp:Transcript_52529/g.94237  ORF Transcript_52529/g.94237 Transcript_52529/m.94237 type:complete len:151 (+) Transcript_52529:38-490(+)|eukprot:CAMPEP_0197632428 /NCGR_PEP_ID=MMETSP1338-20131121/9185_1 /TAXON_ID=43686 ORGANISM="Pelagodinium beii, Strain RCC1491" /NCGR_SAMPLE_ID=MMETSP1338 /ASSEMBLY_ACC=CAM_ASM_000754 /LENGTH=150 /DNA_ID=CAMNT_0043203993 /DNA_START=36 /DNA_END=488 /DNA_ORIENTATION=-